jgi:hypothetical protein
METQRTSKSRRDIFTLLYALCRIAAHLNGLRAPHGLQGSTSGRDDGEGQAWQVEYDDNVTSDDSKNPSEAQHALLWEVTGVWRRDGTAR